jgi:DNA-binding transcriptional MerR regulator
VLERREDAAVARVYTAGQVARALGIAETTLRSWHRRYRIGPHAASPGGYRRYTADDVARLTDMRDLIRAGMLASDAARSVSGRRPALLLDRLATASRDLDSRACQAIVTEAVRAHGVIEAWEGLCRPALLDVEAEQRSRGGGLACVPREHVLSWGIAAALHQVTPADPAPDHPAVMLACTDSEQHTLPLDALAAALAEHGVPVRVLGAAVPSDSLLDAVRATRPGVVVLWAQRPETASSGALAGLRRLRVRRMTAGPGWPVRRRGAGHVDSLPAALAALGPQR